MGSFSRPLSLLVPSLAVDNATIQMIADTLSVKKIPHGVLSGAFNKFVLVNGQDETMTTAINVTGIAVGDELVSVIVLTGGTAIGAARALTDFTIGAGHITVGANAANNSANKYLIFWNDLTT